MRQGPSVLVIGGGPAGLTSAYALARAGLMPLVLEKDTIVGGIARTEVHQGYRFDMGGHRFFTKSREVEAIWRDLLGSDFLRRPRLSRIFYRGRFFHYPLRVGNALRGLGLFESIMIVLSYGRWRLFPYAREDTFAQWTTNRFGRRLFRTFFQSYTEKVWGISTWELSSDWARQRIKNLSLKSALLSSVVRPRERIVSLIEEFDYPRLGPGMMWEAARARIIDHGGDVALKSEVVRLHRAGARIEAVTIRDGDGERRLAVREVISSMPITEAIARMDPPPDHDVLEAASKLTYRDFLTVCLIIDAPELFPDNWIYVHDPKVKVGRIQNFKNWSLEMVADARHTSLGLEYFCNEGDELWSLPDDALIALGTRELEQLGLVEPGAVIEGCVFRVPKSYPVYDAHYGEALSRVRSFVEALENFQTVGRNGLHRYNNQDHSMLTGLLAVDNLLNAGGHDLWEVNTERSYLEELPRPREDALAA